MMRFLKLLILFTLLTGCSGNNQVPARHELELAIANNLVFPFNNFDTLLLEPSKAVFIDPPAKEEEKKVFNCHLDSGVYLSVLAHRIQKPVVIWTSAKQEAWAARMVKNQGPESWYNYLDRRLLMSLDGRITGHNEVTIRTKLQHQQMLWTVENRFSYKDDQWIYQIVNISSSNLNPVPAQRVSVPSDSVKRAKP